MNISTTYSPYSLSQSLARIELNKAEDLYNEMAQHFWPMIGTANQCAYLAMDAAIDAMQEAGIFRQQVKRDAQRAVEEFHKYERLCLHHFKEIEDERFYLWQDLVGHAADKLQPDVEKLFFAAIGEFDFVYAHLHVLFAHKFCHHFHNVLVTIRQFCHNY